MSTDPSALANAIKSAWDSSSLFANDGAPLATKQQAMASGIATPVASAIDAAGGGGGGGGAALGSASPQPVGTAAVGVATSASREDHVHAHGNQAGGSLHAQASGSVDGFMSAADKTKLDAITGTHTGTNTGDVSLAAVGSSPSANGASIAGQVLTLQPADATHPGLVTTGAQTIAGAKTFSGAISASNLSGTNTGDVTIGTANGLSLVGQALSLAAATTGAAGAMSAADKSKLDGVSSPTTYTKWDKESSTTPSTGSFTTFAETGITGQSITVDTASGNALKITQTTGDSSWAHVHGVYTNAPSSADYSVRANFRLQGAPLSQANRILVGGRSTFSSSQMNGYRFGLLADNTNPTLYLVKQVSGTQTNLKGPVNLTALCPAAASGDHMQLSLDFYGNWIMCRVNGILLWRVYDTSFSSAGIAWIGAEPSGSGTTALLLADYFDVISHVGVLP
jgi:hypothetical protein